MSDKSTPRGKPYSRLYMAPTEPRKDSARARVRFGAIASRIASDVGSQDIHDRLVANLGLSIPWSGFWDFPKFFKESPLQDMLDALTGIYRAARFHQEISTPRHYGSSHNYAAEWRDCCREVLAEEAMGYTMDEEGGIHPVIDVEFEYVRVAAVKLLGDPRYSNVRNCFEAAHSHFEAVTPDYKASIRSIFEALESLMRLMTRKRINLGAAAVREHLVPHILDLQEKRDATACDTVEGMLQAFGAWTNSLHPYRHGQGGPEPVTPSAELAAFVLSTGAAYLRWLLEFDRQQVAAEIQ